MIDPNWAFKGRIYEVFGSQYAFAYTVKEREDVVSAVVRGRRSISLEKKEKWAKALNSTVQELWPA